MPEASETQVNKSDLDGISRCRRVVIWEPPYSEYCYLHTAIRMQLVESWLLGMLPLGVLRTGQNPPASCLTVGSAANILMLVAERGCGKSMCKHWA